MTNFNETSDSLGTPSGEPDFPWSVSPGSRRRAIPGDTGSIRLSRSERRRAKATSRAGAISAWRPRLLDLPVVLALAVLGLLLGPAGSLGMGLFVTAQGTPLLVSPGTTGSQLAQLRHLDPRSGAKLDIAGDVRRGQPIGSVEVLNSEDSPNAVLRHGAELVAVEGRAIIEGDPKSEDIRFKRSLKERVR